MLNKIRQLEYKLRKNKKKADDYHEEYLALLKLNKKLKRTFKKEEFNNLVKKDKRFYG